MANSIHHWVFIVSLLIIFTSCGKDKDKLPVTPGIIVVEAATRGVYQYLIEVKGQRYWPENLPEKYKIPTNNNLEVLLDFIVLNNQKEIFLPSPNDIPVFAYSVPVIHILEIKKK